MAFDIEEILRLSQGFREAALGAKQQQVQSQLSAQAPELLAQSSPESLSQLAGLGLQAGDPSIMRQMVESQLRAQAVKPVGETAQPYSLESLKLLGAPELAGLTLAEQKAVLSGRESASERALRERGLKQQAVAAERRDVADVRSERKAFREDFEKEKTKLEEEKRAIDKTISAFKQGTVTGDAVVFNFIARNISGDKGSLSEGDIARILSRNLGGDAQRVINFVTNVNASVLTSDQRKAYGKLLQMAQQNYSRYRDERLGEKLQMAQSDFPRLFEKGADKSVVDRAKSEGFDVKVTTGGVSFEKKGEPKELRVQAPSGGQTPSSAEAQNLVAPIQAEISKIKDSKTRELYLRKLQERVSGKALSESAAQQMLEIVKKAVAEGK